MIALFEMSTVINDSIKKLHTFIRINESNKHDSVTGVYISLLTFKLVQTVTD